MMPAPLRLKRASGWFAAGQEVAAALEVLSGNAFKLYVYLCLNAERHTGRFDGKPSDAVHLFHGGEQECQAAWRELVHQQICLPRVQAVEICDRFWPYEKIAIARPDPDPAGYAEQVREMLVRRACIRLSFSAADRRMALNFHAQGITLVQIDRAIWLGCVRKYVALLNGQTTILITSLNYFPMIVEEVAETAVGEGYWEHVKRTAEKLERRWIDQRQVARRPSQKTNEMMETK